MAPSSPWQKAIPLLRDNGSIVLIGSNTHDGGNSRLSAYAASKAAVRSFARTWADDLKGRNIRVNNISPGPIDTPIIDVTLGGGAAQRRAEYRSVVPLGRMGRPEEIASVALFLACDESSFMTGCDLVVDGGMSQL